MNVDIETLKLLVETLIALAFRLDVIILNRIASLVRGPNQKLLPFGKRREGVARTIDGVTRDQLPVVSGRLLGDCRTERKAAGA